MNLYLVQHGEATSGEENHERPLTATGRAAVEAMAAHVARHAAIHVDRILHSGKLRAGQTAEILATHLNKTAEPSDALKPMDDPSIWANRIKELNGNMMLVGHMPHLSRLASLLACGDPKHPLIKFRYGSPVAMGRDSDSIWTVRWVLTLDIVL